MSSKKGMDKEVGSKYGPGLHTKLDMKERGAKHTETDKLGKKASSKGEGGFRNNAIEHKR